MREITRTLLGLAIACILLILFFTFSTSILHTSLNIPLLNTTTTSSSKSSTNQKSNNINIINRVSRLSLSFRQLSLNEFGNNVNRTKTVFIVYSRPGSTYGEISYFLVATYSKIENNMWIMDNSGTFKPPEITRCPALSCNYVCYTIRLVYNFKYLPHTGIPHHVYVIEGSTNTVLYDPSNFMLKPYNGNVIMYRICTYIPKIDLVKVLSVSLLEYRNIKISKVYTQIDPNYRNIILRYFKNYVSNCRTLLCLVRNVLIYFSEHYKYTPYIEVSGNLVQSLISRRYINCLGANTLLVLILRSFGIPARLAAGFIGSPYSSYQEIKLNDAHAWTQVYVPDVGWITLDATPGIVNMYLKMLGYAKHNVTGARREIERYPHEIYLTLIRGGPWNCTSLRLRSYTWPRAVVIPPPELTYNYYVYEIGYETYNITICYKALREVELGNYSSRIFIFYNGESKRVELNVKLRVKAGTHIKIMSIFPKYVSPGSTFIVTGELLNDENDPIPHAEVIVRILTEKHGKILKQCKGSTDKFGKFRIACTVPLDISYGKYYIEVLFPGNSMYENSSTDPYIYVTRRYGIYIITNGYCVKSHLNTSIVCIYSTDRVYLRIRLGKIINNVSINILRNVEFNLCNRSEEKCNPISTNNIKVFKYGDSIVVAGLLRNVFALRITYSGSRQYAYFDINIVLVRCDINIKFLNYLTRSPIITYYRNDTLNMIVEMRPIPIPLVISYKVYRNCTEYKNVSNLCLQNNNVVKSGYVIYPEQRYVKINLLNLTPGIYIIKLRLEGLPSPELLAGHEENYGGQVISRYLVHKIDPPNTFISCRSISLGGLFEVRSVLSFRDVKYSINILSRSIEISGFVIDKFTKRPVSYAYVCHNDSCVEASSSGFFLISVPLESNIKLVAKYGRYYDSASIVIKISPIIVILPYILMGVVGMVIAFSLYVIVRKIRKHRYVPSLSFGRVGNVEGIIRLLSIGKDEPPVWGIDEPLEVEVDVIKDGERVPDNDIRVIIPGIYEGIGRYHKVLLRDEGIYTIQLYYNSTKICEVYVKVVNYRSEIGRIFSDFISKVLGKEAEYVTPRSLIKLLINRGYPENIVKRIVQIHEIVTYGKLPVNRRLFIEFVTLITSLGYSYNLAGVPQR